MKERFTGQTLLVWIRRKSLIQAVEEVLQKTIDSIIRSQGHRASHLTHVMHMEYKVMYNIVAGALHTIINPFNH